MRLVSDTVIAISVVVFFPCLFGYCHRLFVRPFQRLLLTPSLTIPRRPTLRIILVNYKASDRSVGAPSMRNAPGDQGTRAGYQTVYRHLGWASRLYQSSHGVLMECGWGLSKVGKETLRVLEELETKFPGKSFSFSYKHL